MIVRWSTLLFASGKSNSAIAGSRRVRLTVIYNERRKLSLAIGFAAPPTVPSSWPETARTESRSVSMSSLCSRLKCERSLLSGSASGLAAVACPYVLESRILRCSFLILHPFETKSAAR